MVDNIVEIASILVLLLIASYVGTLVLGNLRLARAATGGVEAERKLLDVRVAGLVQQQLLERERVESKWNGFRKFEVWKKIEEGGGICSFYLRPHDKKKLPPFHPGQYLTFRLQLPNDKQATTIRCYSLSDSANQEFYRVSIKRNPPPRDAAKANLAASVSNFFHDQINFGAILDVKAPAGGFWLDLTHHTPIVLIGGGVGVTPVLSMLNAVAASHSTREVWFFYGVRNKAEHIMREHFAMMEREYPNFHINICYSEPTKDCVAGVDYQHAERVSVELFKKVLPSNNYHFYLCGPPPMMTSLYEDLTAWGVPEEAVHFEAFGPATIKKVAAQQAAPATTEAGAAISVTFATSGKVVPWDGKVASLLELAESNGVSIASGCRAGNCGTCVTAIKSGDVRYIREPGEKPEAGSCLTCISVPKVDLVLNA